MFYIFSLWKIIEWIFYVLFPILAKLEMDQLVEKNQQLFWIIELNSFNIFLIILLIIFSFKFIENILKSFIELFEYDYIKMYNNYYSEALYKRLWNVEPWLFLNSRNKRFVWDIIWNSTQVWDWVRSFLWNLISNIFVVIWIFTVLALINIWIFVILLLSSIFIYFIEKYKQSLSERENLEDKYEFDEKIWILTEQMRNNLSYLMWSWWFKMIFSYYTSYNDIIRKRVKNLQKRNLILNVISFVTENISELLVKLIVWFGIFFATTSIWTMTLVLLYAWRVNELFDFFRSLKFDFDRFKDDLSKLDLFLEITSITDIKDININDFNSISFINTNFSYPNFAKEELKYLEIIEKRIKSYSRQWEYEMDQLHLIEETRLEAKNINPIILNNINLLFAKGKTYGLVWKNWAWKTTIISLIMSYFKDYEWSILVDSKELKLLKRDFFVDNISVINQIPYIINWFSIRENLMLWVEKKYDDEFIFNLLNKFWLKDKILKNRMWLDSRVWYDNDFSGWEKQLIALIRVILQDRKVLIMDEWTNQLDAENELLVMNELLKNKEDKIVIFITHRMTTIRKVDKIYCLENWTITASWTHLDLLNWKNIYSSFWKKQVEE